MDWILMLVGVIFLASGLWLKYRQAGASSLDTDRKDRDDILDINLNKQQQRLQMINQEMDRIIRDIGRKEKLIKQELARMDMTARSSQHPTDYTGEQPAPSFKRYLKESQTEVEARRVPGKYQAILELAEKGFDEEEIARSLNLGLRETTLILKLYRKEDYIVR